MTPEVLNQVNGFFFCGNFGDPIPVGTSYVTFNTVTADGITCGNIQAFFWHGDTVNLPVGTFYYDLEVTYNGSVVGNGYFALGQFTILPSVGRIPPSP